MRKLRCLVILSGTALAGCADIQQFQQQIAKSNLRAVAAEDLDYQNGPPFATGTASYITGNSDSLSDAAAGLAGAVNGLDAFRATHVVASAPVAKPPAPAPATSASFTISYDATLPMAWSASTKIAGGGTEALTLTSNGPGFETVTLTGTPSHGDVLSLSSSASLKDAIAAIVTQSEKKCGAFLNGLVLYETGTNTAADVAATVTSALGTAFKPLGTVHALSAATSIITGSKTAIDSNVFAKASISNFSSAIQATYYSDMNNYVAGLEAADAGSLIWNAEIYKISVIHRECALAPAEGSIAKALHSSTAPAQPPASTPPASLSVSYTTAAGSLSDIAKGLVNLVNNNKDFQAAGVSAVPGQNGSFSLRYPVATTYAWSVSKTGAAAKEQVAFDNQTGNTTVTVSGPVSAGDTISITGVPSSAASAPAAPPAPAAAPAPAPPRAAFAPGARTTPNGVVPGHAP